MKYYFYLYILKKDGKMERHLVTRFSNLSETKSKFYYFETPSDVSGKGTTIKREEVDCIDIFLYSQRELDEMIRNQNGIVHCIDCKYLELELPYGVCSKAYKGIVNPDDSCGKGVRRTK